MTDKNSPKIKQEASPKGEEADKIFCKSELRNALYHACRRLAQVFMVFVIIGIIATAVLWLRLQAGPINLDFAQPKIEALINDQIADYSVEFEHINLIWTNIQRPFLINVDNLSLFQNDKKVTDITSAQLGLSPFGFLRGKILPKFIRLNNPQIIIVENEGAVSICCRVSADSVSEKIRSNDETVAVKREVSDISNPKKAIDIKLMRNNIQQLLNDILYNNLKNNYRIFQHINEIELENVGVFWLSQDEIEKEIGQVDLSLKQQRNSITIDLKGALQIEGMEEQNFDTFMTYRGRENDLTVVAKVQNLNSSFWNQFISEGSFLKKQNYILNGDIQAAFDNKFKLSSAKLDVSIPEGQIDFDSSEVPAISINEAVLESYFNRSQNILNIEKFNGNIGGILFNSYSKGSFDKGNISLPVSINIPDVQMQEISNLIPQSKADSSGLSWPKSKLQDGSLNNFKADFALNMTRDKETRKRSISIDDVSVNFDFEGMKIIYVDTLPPVTQAQGTASYENDVLTVRANSSRIDQIQSDNVVFTMTDMMAETGTVASLEIDAMAPAKSIFDYLENEPIGLKDIGLETDKTKGDVTAKVNIDFPIHSDLKGDEFNVVVNATLNNMLVPNIVQNLPLAGGPYTLKYNDQKLSIKGSGALASRPITIDWQQDIANDTIRLTADIVSDEGLRQAFGVNLNQYLKGPVPINIIYEEVGNRDSFDLKADLLESTIAFDIIGFKKEKNVPGSMSLKGLLVDKSLKEIDGLTINTNGLDFKNGRLIFSQDPNGNIRLTRGSLKDINLADNTLSVEFESTPENILKAIVTANILDISSFLDDGSSQKTEEKSKLPSSLKLSLSANSMIMKNDLKARDVKVYYETNNLGKTNQMEVDALIGQGNLVLRFKPNVGSDTKKISLETSDAGSFLNATGLYTNITGGFLKVDGTSSANNTNTIMGKARIDNFKVKDAPILAKLMNTLSLSGVLRLLSNEGLSFTRLESDFEWRFREKGDLLIVKEGRSSGASLGLTFEGVVNREIKEVDLSGNVIPMSEVNKLIGDIPVIGDILTGGDALLAATYSIKGPTSDPRVSVNPLAALAPGFLRKILFEEDIENKIKKAE